MNFLNNGKVKGEVQERRHSSVTYGLLCVIENKTLMRFLLVTLGIFPLFIQAQNQRPAVFDSLQLIQTDTIYFASGQAVITSEADSVLRRVGPQSPGKDKVYLTGHTDAVGSLSYNENLAKRRANAAIAVLQELGWDSTDLIVKTFGERQPAVRNDSENNRQRNRRVTIDQYRPIPYRAFLGQVIDPADGSGVQAQVRVHSRSISDTLRTNTEGRFQVDLPIDSVVGFDIYAQGYFYASEYLKIKLDPMPPLQFELPKAEVGAAIDIPNLYFYGNKDILLPRSAPELPKIQRFLEMNPGIQVEIAGHVNYPNQPPVTQNTFEWKLSVRRAQRVYEWLMDHRIPEEQITYQGYGNHQMRFPHARSERDQSLNRRVEIKVISTGEVISIPDKR